MKNVNVLKSQTGILRILARANAHHESAFRHVYGIMELMAVATSNHANH